MPCTFRKVSCWPANDASGKSSAVADERTAKLTVGLLAVSSANDARTAASKSAGNGASSTHCRIWAPAAASALTSSVSSASSRALILSVRPPCCKKARKAWAVVAKPPGTRTPVAASWLIISPRLAFLPPTTSTSCILRCSNGMTRAVARWVEDMGKLRDGGEDGQQAHACQTPGRPTHLQPQPRTQGAGHLGWGGRGGCGRGAWQGNAWHGVTRQRRTRQPGAGAAGVVGR